jgi:uncharacterized membrane protein YtjA (UPF0391 family)
MSGNGRELIQPGGPEPLDAPLRSEAERYRVTKEKQAMFSWAIAFLIIALIAAALGFGGLAGTAMTAAKLIFIVALIAFVASAAFGFARSPCR